MGVLKKYWSAGWRQCDWCWKWGKSADLSEEDKLEFPQAVQLYDVDMIGKLCEECTFEREKPPWYPNASDRAANAMLLFLPQKLHNWALRKHMSEFVFWNDQ